MTDRAQTIADDLTHAARDIWDGDVAESAERLRDGDGAWHAIYMAEGDYGVHEKGGRYFVVFAADGVDAGCETDCMEDALRRAAEMDA
jgi:hypothetical protein